MKYTHYTNFGVSMQPREADGEGYLAYRDGYEDLPRETWTAAEQWIAAEEARLVAWRKRQY